MEKLNSACRRHREQGPAKGHGLHVRCKGGLVSKYLFGRTMQGPGQLETFWYLLKEAVGIHLFGVCL